MRYAAAYPPAPRQARSLRIGHCARCHAAVLADEEHYGDGPDLVHAACGSQPVDPGDRVPAGLPRPAVQQARRLRRVARLPSTCTTGKL